jgi:hypothetical protein
MVYSDIDKFMLAIGRNLFLTLWICLCGFLSVLSRWHLAGENYAKESSEMTQWLECPSFSNHPVWVD